MAAARVVQRGAGFNNNARASLSRMVGSLGRIGKALLFPIAALPIAAILVRIGAAIPETSTKLDAGALYGTEFADGVGKFLAQSGQFFFSNLHIAFGVGVAFGLTRDNRGEAAFVGLLSILLLTAIMNTGGVDLANRFYKTVDLPLAPNTPATNTGFHRLFSSTLNDGPDRYDPILSQNVLAGFATGGLTAFIYNRFNGVELPTALSFFSGRRLVPVLGILCTMVFTILWAAVFPWVGYLLFLLSDALASARNNRFANAGIMGAYAILNRLLIPFGLHHIPNTLFWFTLDTGILTPGGKPISGDINAFAQGVAANNTAGTFQTGFFPIMMFGLPALIVAFWFNADNKDQKREVIALYGSAAMISFLTGITEPIEFAFLFIAPALYGLHVLLSGLFAFITGLFGIQLGFGFSAGLIDYGISLPKSLAIIEQTTTTTAIQKVFANPGWIWPIGLVTGLTYFGLGTLLIKKLNLQVPGRGKGRIEKEVFVTTTGQKVTVATGDNSSGVASPSQLSPRASTYVKALGGYENITNYQNCTTRLRYDVKNADIVNDDMLKKAGAKGVIHVGKTHVQIVVGLEVEALNNEIISGKPKN